MVNNKDRRDAQMAYRADKYIFEEMSVCRKKISKLTSLDYSDFDGIKEATKDLSGKSENAFLTPLN